MIKGKKLETSTNKLPDKVSHETFKKAAHMKTMAKLKASHLPLDEKSNFYKTLFEIEIRRLQIENGLGVLNE